MSKLLGFLKPATRPETDLTCPNPCPSNLIIFISQRLHGHGHQLLPQPILRSFQQALANHPYFNNAMGNHYSGPKLVNDHYK